MLYEVAITKTSVGQNKRKGVVKERIVLQPTSVAAEDENAAVLKASAGLEPDGLTIYVREFGKAWKAPKSKKKDAD